jgi:hypothetical protein
MTVSVIGKCRPVLEPPQKRADDYHAAPKHDSPQAKLPAGQGAATHPLMDEIEALFAGRG